MELSVLGTVQFHYTFTAHSTYNFSFPSIPSCLAPSISRTVNSQRSLSTASTSAEAVALLEESDKPNGQFTAQRQHSKSYLARQAAILEVQQSSDLDSALQRLGGIFKAQDLNVILRSFGKQSRWQDLSKLFDWMLQHGKVNVASYTSYMKYMGKSLNPAKAIKIYNGIPDELAKNNVAICNSVLACLVRSGKFDSSLKLFRKMKQNGLKPDTITYSTLLAGCIKVKSGYSKALDLVQELKYNELQMDSVMYGTLLAVCASNNQCEEAESFFNQMKNEGHSPNVFHYSSLLNAYASTGNYKKAEELVQDMKYIGLALNKVIWTNLLKVYVKAGLFEKSRGLLLELETMGHAEDEMPYCLLMDGLSKSGYIDEARLVFDEMEKKGVKSDGYAHSIMISAYCRGKLWEEARQLAKEFEAKYDKYDLVILNTMLGAYCRAGDMESVMQTMKKMDELAISPSYNTYHILIKYFCKQNLYLLAYQTMEDMHRKGHQPEEELCSLLIFHLGKDQAHGEAFSVYTMLKYGKRTMCKALHEKILHILIAGQLLKESFLVVKDNSELISQGSMKKFANAFMKLGNINMINDVMKVIHSSGCKIDQNADKDNCRSSLPSYYRNIDLCLRRIQFLRTGPNELFQMAISRYIAQPEKKDLLLQLLQWMPGQGYIVDSSTRNLILKNSHLFGRRLIADILSKQHFTSKALKSL